MKISVRVHEVYDNENSKVKGLASAALGGQFAVNGIKIVEGKKGLFVTMPSKMNDEGDYKHNNYRKHANYRRKYNRKRKICIRNYNAEKQ